MNMLERYMAIIFGVSFYVFIYGFICWFIYSIGWGWIFYPIGLLLVILGVYSLVESSQLKQKAKKIKRIYQNISDGWK